MTTKDDTLRTELDDMSFVIPDYPPMDVPYSSWQREREKQFLEANGYGAERQDWIKACSDSFVLTRMAGMYLLTENPLETEKEVYREALNDIEHTVRALAAYGLVQLGEREYLSVIREVAAIDDGISLCVYQAAGVMGSLNLPEGFSVIEKGVHSTYEAVRISAMHNAYRFLPMWEALDLKGFYAKMLKHSDERVRLIARLQLEELGNPAAQELLKEE